MLYQHVFGVAASAQPLPVSEVHLRGHRLIVSGPAAFRPDITNTVSRCFVPSLGLWSFPATPAAAMDLWRLIPESEGVLWDERALRLVNSFRSERNAIDSARLMMSGTLPAPEMAGRYLHQRAGMHAFQDATRGLVHWGMGTGKTRWALDLIHRTGARWTLIVCKRSCILEPWKSEIESHPDVASLPALYLTSDRCDDPAVVGGSTARKATALSDRATRGAIVVVNYESIWRAPLSDSVKSIPWDLLICDEIQAAKGHDAKQAVFLAELAKQVPRRFGLSGTPVPQEAVTDSFGVFRILDAGIFGENFYSHRARYALVGELQLKRRDPHGRERTIRVKKIMGYQREDDFRERFNSITFAVRTEDVIDLPPETHIKRFFELPARARRRYDDVKKGKEGGPQNKLIALMQITGGIKHDVHDGRAKALADILEEIPEPVVVFCRFRADLDKIRDLCDSLERPAFEFSGRNIDHRQRLLEAWRETKEGVLIAQIEAAAEGINLTHARYNVFYSQTFVHGKYRQALKRSRRKGQHRHVFYIHLMARDTVDELLLQAHEERKNIIDWITRDPSLLE